MGFSMNLGLFPLDGQRGRKTIVKTDLFVSESIFYTTCVLAPLGDFYLAGEPLSERWRIGGMRCRCLETLMDTGFRRSDVANHLPRRVTIDVFVQQVPLVRYWAWWSSFLLLDRL